MRSRSTNALLLVRSFTISFKLEGCAILLLSLRAMIEYLRQKECEKRFEDQLAEVTGVRCADRTHAGPERRSTFSFYDTYLFPSHWYAM
jgi:hypothetical protein